MALSDIDLHFAWQVWHLATWNVTLRGVALMALGWLWWRAWLPAMEAVTHHLSHTTLSHTILHTPLCQHHLSPHHLSNTQLSHTTLSPIIFHTQLCHTPSFTTPSFTHHFVTHHLSHTTLSHALFQTQLSHTPSFTHNFVTHTHHLSLSHTIFHIRLCPTQLFLLLDPSPPTLSFLPSQSRYNICCSLLEVDLWGYRALEFSPALPASHFTVSLAH